MTIEAIIFDLDGVLIDSEPVWEAVRRDYSLSHGGQWADDAQPTMMGMSTQEWATFLHRELGVAGPVARIAEDVITEMVTRFRGGPPLVPGAVEVVRRLGRDRPLGLASSSPRRLIDAVLESAGLT